MAQIQTPDSIGVGSVGINPQAQPQSTYATPTAPNLAHPYAGEGSLGQLSDALRQITPTVANAVQSQQEKQKEYDLAAGETQAEVQARGKTLEQLKQLQKEGRVPDGASPNYLFAYKANLLKYQGQQTAQNLHEAYLNEPTRSAENFDVHSWTQNWLAKNDMTHNEDGTPNFTSLEIQHSKYYDATNQAAQNLAQFHSNYRNNENVKLAEQNWSDFATSVLDKGVGTKSPAELAAAMNDVADNPDTGMVTHGGASNTKRAAINLESLKTVALTNPIAAQNPDWMRSIAQQIKTPGGTMADTTDFKNAEVEVRAKLTTQRYDLEKMQDFHEKQPLQGKTIDEKIANGVTKYGNSNSDIAKKQLTEAYQQKYLDYGENLTPQESKDRADLLTQMRHVDADAAIKTLKIDENLRRPPETRTEVNNHKYAVNEMGLSDQIASHADDPAGNLKRINTALTNGDIDGDAWRRQKAAIQDASEYKDVFSDPAVTSALTASGRATFSGKLAPLEGLTGIAAYHEQQAKNDMRNEIIDFIKTSKTPPTPVQIRNFAAGRVKDIGERYNTAVADEAQSNAEQAQNESVRANAKAAGLTDKDIKQLERAAAPNESAAVTNARIIDAANAKKTTAPGFFERMNPFSSTPSPAAPTTTPTPAPKTLTPAPQTSVDLTHFNAAKKDLNLTPQEQNIYQHHLTNLNGNGKVINKDKSISTVYQSTFTVGDKTYNIPTVWDGKILEPDAAFARAKKEGLDKFPSYGSPQEAEARYQKIHDYMAADTTDYIAKNSPQPTPQQLSQRLTTPDKTFIVDTIRQAYEPGVSEKPISQGVMRDRVRAKLAPHYTNPAELDRAVSEIIDRLTQKYKTKK